MKSINTKLSDNNILFVGPLPPPNGGIAFLTKALLEGGLANGLKLTHLNTSKNTLVDPFDRVTWLDIRMAIYNFIRFSYMVVRQRPGVIYLITTAGRPIYTDGLSILVARLARCRVLLHLHGVGASEPAKEHASHRFHRALVRAIASMASYIVVPTALDLQSLRERYEVHVPSEVVRNTVHVPPCFLRSLKTRKGELGTVSLIAIGRLCKLKGAWDLLRAFALILRQEPGATLTWIGIGASPSDHEYARRLCASLGVANQVRLIGAVSESEKYLELTRSDIFCLPSHSEAFPLALVEAMATALPVVTTPVGAIPEIIKDGVNGYLIPVGDIDMLAKRILDLVKDPHKRERIGKTNLQLYWQQLSARSIVNRVQALIRELA